MLLLSILSFSLHFLDALSDSASKNAHNRLESNFFQHSARFICIKYCFFLCIFIVFCRFLFIFLTIRSIWSRISTHLVRLQFFGNIRGCHHMHPFLPHIVDLSSFSSHFDELGLDVDKLLSCKARGIARFKPIPPISFYIF